jgi:hypothetical protein
VFARFPGSTSGPPVHASKLHEWSPIPQTACEVCAIARQLRVPPEEIDRQILLGGRLREAEIKRLGAPDPDTGRSALQDYKILHFATHGAIADAVWHFKEPGLILTPPPENEQSEEDDGYASLDLRPMHRHPFVPQVCMKVCRNGGFRRPPTPGACQAQATPACRSFLSKLELHAVVAIKGTVAGRQILTQAHTCGPGFSSGWGVS